MDYKRGSHSTYDLKYHIVFCTKYQYRILTGPITTRDRELMREICQANYVDIVSGSMSPDHVHLLLLIPLSISVSKIVQYVKGKMSRKLLQEFEGLKKGYWDQHLWARWYFAVTVGNVNSEDVQRYIEQQEEHHKWTILRSPNSERSRFQSAFQAYNHTTGFSRYVVDVKLTI